MQIAALFSGRTSTRTSWLAVARPRRRHAAGPGRRRAGPGGHRPVRAGGQQDLVREQQAGQPALGVGRLLRGRVRRRSRASRPRSGQRRPARRLQDRHQRVGLHIDIYRTGYYDGDGARKIASVTPSASLPQNQPNCISDVATRALRLRQLGRLRVVERARPRPSPASTSRACTARTSTSPATSPSSSATTPATSRPRLPDRRHHLAGLQHLRRLQLLPGRRQRPRLQAQLQPADADPRRHAAAATSTSPTSTPLCASWRRTATTSPTSPASTPTAAATCCSTTRPTSPSGTTSTGAVRSAPTSRRPATPGST